MPMKGCILSIILGAWPVLFLHWEHKSIKNLLATAESLHEVSCMQLTRHGCSKRGFHGYFIVQLDGPKSQCAETYMSRNLDTP